MHIKTKTRYLFTPTKMTIIKKQTAISIGKGGCEKNETLILAGGTEKWSIFFGKQSRS
jgi:hypothetical protein